MNCFHLLIVEDNEQDLQTCRDTVKRYQQQHDKMIEIIECKTADEAIEKLRQPCDGAIIDIKLARQGNEGNRVIKAIEESYSRIPIAIFTGTPNTADEQYAYVGVFKKGEVQYDDMLDRLLSLYNAGLTNIMGRRGIIEQELHKVFKQNLLPQCKTWGEYGKKDSVKTEKGMLRYTLNHLLQLLDDDADVWFPEEVYIYPPLCHGLRTGSIVCKRNKEAACMVLTPACDLVVRENGNFKTDRVLLLEIESITQVVGSSKDKNRQDKLFKNTFYPYYHWLPTTEFFKGGFVNFRRLSTLTQDTLKSEYDVPFIQASPSFVKDIVARFSSYYARQGQPDIAMRT